MSIPVQEVLQGIVQSLNRARVDEDDQTYINRVNAADLISFTMNKIVPRFRIELEDRLPIADMAMNLVRGAKKIIPGHSPKMKVRVVLLATYIHSLPPASAD